MLSGEIKTESGVTGSGLCKEIRKLLYAIIVHIYIFIYLFKRC